MSPETYQCPGENYTISRSVHLGRLARFYPNCRECPHRHDTGGLARRVVRALEALPARKTLRFDDFGVRGVYLNEIDRATAREVAGCFGLLLRQRALDVPSAPAPSAQAEMAPHPTGIASGKRMTKVVVARDEHPCTPDLAVGAIDGLRYAGCEVIDLGVASSPCLVFCIQHLEADGGVMLCGDAADSSVIGLRLWRQGGGPLDGDTELRAVQAMLSSGIQRPTRSASPYSSFHGSVPYLACLLKHFHALRPLKVAALCTSRIMEQYVSRLFSDLVCTRIHPETLCEAGEVDGDRVAEVVTESRAHVGVLFNGDGERATFFDEHGRIVGPESILLLLVRGALREHRTISVVLEEGASEGLHQAIVQLGAQVVAAPARPAAMTRALGRSAARLGGGPSGRIWIQNGGPAADAILTLSGVLAALSWTDSPMSSVIEPIG
jgi:phosphomannomutase